MSDISCPVTHIARLVTEALNIADQNSLTTVGIHLDAARIALDQSASALPDVVREDREPFSPM